MKGGTLRWPITIEQKTATQNPTTGEMTYTWSAFLTTRADVQEMARRGSRAAWEAVIAQQVLAQTVAMFVIRYQTGITELMRINFNGQYWDIKSIINPDSRNRELWLMAEFGLDQG